MYDLIVLLPAMVFISIFSVMFADYFIVQRRAKRMVQIIKNELLHSPQIEQITRLIGEIAAWWEDNREQVKRDAAVLAKFVHEWTKRLDERKREDF